MCRSLRNVVGIGLLALALATPIIAAPDANTCNGNSEINYGASTPNFVSIGDTVHIMLTLGAGGIQGGTTLHINRVKFNLDCQNTSLGLDCTDDGNVISYQGNLTDSCAGVTFVTTHVAGDLLPNQVVFDYASGSLDIPANTSNFCQIEFDVKVEANSTDGTPGTIEEVSGYNATTNDGICNTTPPLAAGNTNSGSINLCPICDDGNQCNGVETCDPNLGCLPGTPITCEDNNVCTTDTCDTTVPSPTNPCVFTPGAQGDCNDNNVCTTDTCHPVNGCTNKPGAQGSCDDQDVCTTDTCDPINGCTHTPGAQGDCNDNDTCTTDTCDPVNGCVHTPGALNCDDNDVCTTDTCDNGCHNTPGALNCDDNNTCTKDSCDPINGCEHDDTTDQCDDGDACTTDTCDPINGCVNTPNDACALTCRTPGFWGTHADNDPGKNCSQDITGAVLALNGGSVSVCGECIHNSNTGETLAPGDASGALEALCVKVQGQQTRQLTRQLLSAALNCIMSGVGGTCAGTNVIDWATCNAVCQGTSTAKTVGQCIGEIDAFNNGIGTGCHDRALPLDTLFPNGTRCTNGGGPVQGAAGSSSECNAARGNNCITIQPGEANCATDTCP